MAQWSGQQARAVEVVGETAVWSQTGLPPVPIRWVLVRDPHGKFPTQALLCPDLNAAPTPLRAWVVQRWPLEVTVHALRAHWGMETQRQGTPRAIARTTRTTPARLGLFSLVPLLAHPALAGTSPPLKQTAW